MKEQGFFANAFDLSFRSSVTRRVATFLQVVAVLAAAAFVGSLSVQVIGAYGPIGTLVAGVAGPPVFVALVLAARVALELLVSVARIAEALTGPAHDPEPSSPAFVPGSAPDADPEAAPQVPPPPPSLY